MSYEKVLIVTDNAYLYEEFRKIILEKKITSITMEYGFSQGNEVFLKYIEDGHNILPIDVHQQTDWLIDAFDLIISLHCKQVFPVKLIKAVKCINIHPGFNPYNRGCYPQVFSILNQKPCGVTIHEMDELIDHGPIIAQAEVPIHAWDTSLSVYERIIETEMDLLASYLTQIIAGDYSTTFPIYEGNINTNKDFKRLCKIDLEEEGSFGEFLNRLRALSHGKYNNAFFIDSKTGKKIYISITLQPTDANDE